MFTVRRYLALLWVGGASMVAGCSGDDATGDVATDGPASDGSSELGDVSHLDTGTRDAGPGANEATISEAMTDISSAESGGDRRTEEDVSEGEAIDATRDAAGSLDASDDLVIPGDTPAWAPANDAAGSDHAAEVSSDAPQASAHVIFVTSEVYTGDLIGQANQLIGNGIAVPPLGVFQGDEWREAADAICSLHARKASLPGAFRAILQGGSVDAFTAFHDYDGPWALVDGTPVAETVADLQAGNFHASVERTETGLLLRSSVVWGKGETDDDCDGWSSATTERTAFAGTTATVTSSWFGSVRLFCEDSAHLYCLQVGPGGNPNVYPVLPAGARIAFVAKGPYPGDFAAGAPVIDAGKDAVHVAADALCAQAASSASRPGTFHAWISSSTMSAAKYFTSLGMSGPWYRPDGLLVASGLSNLTDARGTSTQIVLMADGAFAGYQGIWTGTEQDGSASADNCNDFTSKSSSVLIRGGATSVKGSDWASVLGAACNISYFGIDCFQE